MDTKFTKKDLEFILQSLKYTKLKFEDYQLYPSYEYQQERIKQVQEVMIKVSNILKATKH